MVQVAVAAFLLFSGFKTQSTLSPIQLDWDLHFKGVADEHSPFAALTATTWHYSYTSTVRNNHLHIDFKFSGGVDPDKSWVKMDRIRDRKTRNILLKHEQGHVYINFILLKAGETTIRNQQYTPNNYKQRIQKTANQISKYYSDLQKRYDDETRHGVDLEAQSKWDNYIQNELAKYN